MTEDIDLDGLVQAMDDLYATEITVDELREEVGVDREALIDEFRGGRARRVQGQGGEFGAPRHGEPLMRELERFVILQVVDTRWREHLENMDYLREGVHLRAMAQKDPLVEYTLRGPRHVRGAERRDPRGGRRSRSSTPSSRPRTQQLLAMQDGHGNGDALEYEHESLAGADAIAAAGTAGGERPGRSRRPVRRSAPVAPAR